MGMFDYIKCERLLPDGLDGTGIEFQTKDFDSTMETITLTPDGRLIHDEWHYVDVPKEKRPYPDAPDGSLQALIGCIKRVVDKEAVDLNFHGYFIFYGNEKNDDDGKWHEYRAKFTDGQAS